MKKTNRFTEGILLVIMGLVYGVLLGLLLTSCSSGPRVVDNEFHYQINNFQKLTNKKVTKSVKFDTLAYNVAGTCKTNGVVVVDAGYWFETNTFQQDSTIYHELMHCYCGQDHDDSVYSDNCPKSFMYRAAIDDVCLAKYWKEYMDDMVGRCK